MIIRKKAELSAYEIEKLKEFFQNPNKKCFLLVIVFNDSKHWLLFEWNIFLGLKCTCLGKQRQITYQYQ